MEQTRGGDGDREEVADCRVAVVGICHCCRCYTIELRNSPLDTTTVRLLAWVASGKVSVLQ
jgi:hypothetical protein